MTDLATELETRIKSAIPGSTVEIDDPDGAHLSAVITSPAFAGKTRIQQHQMVYAALGNAFETTLHALQLTTKAS